MQEIEKSQIESEILEKLRLYSNSFEIFAAECLKIKGKSGEILQLKLNETQNIILNHIRTQYKRKGNLRLVIVKGRQQGCTTFFAAYYLWRALFLKGQDVFILSYLQRSLSEIMDKVNFFYDNLPLFVSKTFAKIPARDKALRFNNASVYSSASAEGRSIRGGTYQMLHLSESSFYSKESIEALMQTVSDKKTMIVFESTPRGTDNAFYHYYKMATQGDSGYEAIFIPWWKELGYKRSSVGDYNPNKEVLDYAQNYNPDLTLEQLRWLEEKMSEMGVDSFNYEYPATPELAFLQNLDDVVIQPSVITKAMNNKNIIQDASSWYVNVGVDIARFGSDKSSICVRHGKSVIAIETFEKIDTNTFSGILRDKILDVMKYCKKTETELNKVFIDTCGIGAGVYDTLKSYSDVGSFVYEGNVANKSIKSDLYINKRSESYFRLKDFLENNDVSLPNNNQLLSELSNIRYKYTQGSKKAIVSKEEMKAQGFSSPDMADSLMLTFFEEEPRRDVGVYSRFDKVNSYNNFNSGDTSVDEYRNWLWR